MIITKDFVMIHFPKTGTSFARKVIKSIHAQRISNSILSRFLIHTGLQESDIQIVKIKKWNRLTQHGSVRDIPKKHLSKEIVSIARNPFSRLLSNFHYQFWLRNPGKNGLKAQAKFENFPDLNLEEFISYRKLVLQYRFENNPKLRNLIASNNIGPHTVDFLEFYFQKSPQALLQLNDEYITSRSYLNDMTPITFLRQENLTDDLCHFLSAKNYSINELDFIRSHDRVNVSQDDPKKSEPLWTQKAIDEVKQSERYLFEIMEHFGIDHNKYTPSANANKCG